ncbi:hypothetical protein OAE26_00740 [Synechococcus sp. AH-551-E05]|nr:hypothetical protein [Synechococcus sp. AH-551-E05]MDB4651093.1 hypothetical protein [Synechococcus sp. AH-551-E05]
MEATTSRLCLGSSPIPRPLTILFYKLFCFSMEQEQSFVSVELGLDALRLMHKVISQAYETWPGGCAEEQECLFTMRNQLYAALMDQLLDIEAI